MSSMRRDRIEEAALSIGALLMAGVAPNIFPAAQAGYATMSYLGAFLLIPSIAVLAAVLAAGRLRGHERLTGRLLAGAGAGLTGTVGLEAVRITSFHLGGMPGDLPRLMGVLLTDRFMLGPSLLSDILGWLYHFWNGACFGIIFAVVLGRRAVWWAVAYGALIGLGFLASPAVDSLGIGFMGIDMPAMPATVMLAHLVYGAILGILTYRWIGRGHRGTAGEPEGPSLHGAARLKPHRCDPASAHEPDAMRPAAGEATTARWRRILGMRRWEKPVDWGLPARVG